MAEDEAKGPSAEDDWAAAMAEQEAAPAAGTAAPAAEDDWAAAMAEQSQVAASAPAAETKAQPQVSPVSFEQLSAGAPAGMANSLDMILDIPVNLTVELGRTKLAIRSLLQLAQGSVVELDGLAGEPMNVLVNGCLIAQGEVVVVNDKFGIRLTDIISPSERIRKLNR
ncbi:MAG: flagellar motor switch protein FliN [Pseudomonadota bacterium]